MNTVRGLICLMLLGLSSCVSNSVLMLARTAPRGTATGYVGPSVARITEVNDSGGTLPQLEAGFHYSVSDNLEVGAKAYIPGVAFDTKIGLLRSPTAQSGFSLAIAPEVGVMGFGVGSNSERGPRSETLGGVAMTFNVPLLIGIAFHGHELVIAPRITDWLALVGTGDTTAGANVLHVGGGVGLAIRLTPNFRLMPNVSVMTPVLGTAFFASADSSGNTRPGTLLAQFGIGFLIGATDGPR